MEKETRRRKKPRGMGAALAKRYLIEHSGRTAKDEVTFFKGAREEKQN